MSKKFRALVGAMLSASICSSCVSSGLSNGVKWAVGVPTIGALVYFGRLGLLEMNRRKKVDICAKKIKKLVGEDNYNVLKKFYELERENLGNSGKPVGSKLASERLILEVEADSYGVGKYSKNVDEIVSWFKEGKSDLLDEVVGHLEFLFKSIFVDGKAEVTKGDGKSEFCFGGYGGFKVWFTNNSVFISCRNASFGEFSFELELRKMK